MVWRSLLLSSYTLEGFVTAPAISFVTRNIYGWSGCCTPIETQSFLFLSFFFLCFLPPSHLSTCSHLTKIGMCPTDFCLKFLQESHFHGFVHTIVVVIIIIIVFAVVTFISCGCIHLFIICVALKPQMDKTAALPIPNGLFQPHMSLVISYFQLAKEKLSR